MDSSALFSSIYGDTVVSLTMNSNHKRAKSNTQTFFKVLCIGAFSTLLILLMPNILTHTLMYGHSGHRIQQQYNLTLASLYGKTLSS